MMRMKTMRAMWLMCMAAMMLGAAAGRAAEEQAGPPADCQFCKSVTRARVVAFGDSITHSGGNKKWKHWTEALRERFGWELFNAGVPGDTTAGGLRRMDKDVLARQPDFVLISFGMNDHVMLGPGKERVKLADYERNLRAMVEKVRQAQAVPVLVTTNYIVEGDAQKKGENYYYNRHDPALYAADGGAQKRLDKYIEAMRKVAREMKVALADVRKACDGHDPKQFTADGVHPARLGNEVYAQVVGDCLAASFE